MIQKLRHIFILVNFSSKAWVLTRISVLHLDITKKLLQKISPKLTQSAEIFSILAKVEVVIDGIKQKLSSAINVQPL